MRGRLRRSFCGPALISPGSSRAWSWCRRASAMSPPGAAGASPAEPGRARPDDRPWRDREKTMSSLAAVPHAAARPAVSYARREDRAIARRTGPGPWIPGWDHAVHVPHSRCVHVSGGTLGGSRGCGQLRVNAHGRPGAAGRGSGWIHRVMQATAVVVGVSLVIMFIQGLRYSALPAHETTVARPAAGLFLAGVALLVIDMLSFGPFVSDYTCGCREPHPRHATRRYSLIRPPTRACLRTRYCSRSTGSGSGFSGAAAFRDRCGRC